MSIIVRDVTFRYAGQDKDALTNACLECDSCGISVVVGRSGVGKSTLISLLAGIYLIGDSVVDTYVGEISIDGHKPSKILGPHMGSWVPQTPVLLDHLSVLGNVLLPTTIAGESTADATKAKEMLKKLGLEYPESRPRDLSGGMRTRVCLVRALVSRPKYLFLDEPFVSLDLMNRLLIYRLLRAERSKGGLTTVLSTHDIPEAVLLGDRIIEMSNVMTGHKPATEIVTVENQAILSSNGGVEACLRAAREAAGPIEKRLFLAC
jgi:NitT/TauT family transport system ATP-binding protein